MKRILTTLGITGALAGALLATPVISNPFHATPTTAVTDAAGTVKQLPTVEDNVFGQPKDMAAAAGTLTVDCGVPIGAWVNAHTVYGYWRKMSRCQSQGGVDWFTPEPGDRAYYRDGRTGTFHWCYDDYACTTVAGAKVYNVIPQ